MVDLEEICALAYDILVHWPAPLDLRLRLFVSAAEGTVILTMRCAFVM